jgi:hypothetical protein
MWASLFERMLCDGFVDQLRFLVLRDPCHGPTDWSSFFFNASNRANLSSSYALRLSKLEPADADDGGRLARAEARKALAVVEASPASGAGVTGTLCIGTLGSNRRFLW